MTSLTRRSFVASAAAGLATFASATRALAAGSQFKIGVITDEISQDFDHACYVISHDFGLGWVEIREMYGKNLQQSSDDEIASAQKVLSKYNLRVTDISSPLFKVNWPDAPVSQYGTPEDLHGAKDQGYKKQDEVLDRSIALAKTFGTGKVRCFDFWRIDNVQPYRAAINARLDAAATRAGKDNIMLVLENEFACNTATGRESGETLRGIPNPNLALNWDPGNAVMRGELDAFPSGFNAIPKDRIHHCHVKNAVKDSSGKIVWSPVDKGYIDWTAQFKALKDMGYSDATNLETHWKGGGTPEASSRVSWAGMRSSLVQSGNL